MALTTLYLSYVKPVIFKANFFVNDASFKSQGTNGYQANSDSHGEIYNFTGIRIWYFSNIPLSGILIGHADMIDMIPYNPVG